MKQSDLFEGATKEEALEKAKSFMARLDYMRQPSINGPYELNGKWVASVEYYGLD